MPTIEIKISDFETLLGRRVGREALEGLLCKVKGEVKEFLPEEDYAKLELNDTNRPDLWSTEGIVRQIHPPARIYPFFQHAAERTVIVSEKVGVIRPYLAACIVHGPPITETMLVHLIQSQEKLAETYGRRREMVSIGLYRLHKIAFPVRYDAVDPDRASFIPLGYDQPASFSEIIAHHPKGIAYAAALHGAKSCPILMDAKGQILSFPPIINSREIGEVQTGDTDLFVEVTGTDLRMVLLTLNIFACNFYDREYTIEPVSIHFPGETEFGKVIRMPFDFSRPIHLLAKDFHRVLGEASPVQEIATSLESFGYTVTFEGDRLAATAPPYRDDTMHPIDVIEDFAISRGYESFRPEMPSSFTIGLLSSIERFSDQIREEMIGHGFEEIISNILSSRQNLIDRMKIKNALRPEACVIDIENPITERFSTLRSWLLPSLLQVEGVSSKAYYPHRVFEVGEVARFRASQDATETCTRLAAMISHPTANFSELHSILEALFYRLRLKLSLEPVLHPSFIEGRAGLLIVNKREVGIIGEIDPDVLTQWQIGMPSAAFEIEAELLNKGATVSGPTGQFG